MTGAFASTYRIDDQGRVATPMPGDVLSPALHAVYGDRPVLPEDMLRLLRMLDRPSRGH